MTMAFDLPHSVTDIPFLKPPIELVAEYQPTDLFVCRISNVHGAMRAEIKAATDKVDELAAMPENWDGYGAYTD
jgi:hypothetical protein